MQIFTTKMPKYICTKFCVDQPLSKHTVTNITSHFILHTVIDLHQVPITKLA